MVPDPTLCTLCHHEAHVGRCRRVTSEDVDTCEPYYCDCPGPSESAERPDGLYWVKWKPGSIWSSAEWAHSVWLVHGYPQRTRGPERCVINPNEIGPRIPSPDEQPCPISAQRVREIAARIPYLEEERDLRTLADWIAKAEGKQ